MRSAMIKAALAAILISTPLAMAEAAPARSTYVPNGQLDAVLADLGNANARIAYERGHGQFTPAEARSLRVETASIRKDALAANKDGMIPTGQYMHLMAQVEDLQGHLYGAPFERYGNLD